MGWQVITSCVLESAGEQSEMEVVLRCKNDVCVGALSVNLTKLYFVCVLHFTVGVTRLLLASRLSLLVINKRYCNWCAKEVEREKRLITVNWPVQIIPCISIVISFSLELKWPQKKLKTMLMQNFGVTNKEYYGMLRYFL